VWPLHGMAGSWGGIAAGIFGYRGLGGLGGVSFLAQFFGTAAAIVYATALGSVVYLALKFTVGIRLTREEEFRGSDLSIHHVSAYPEQEMGTGSPTIVGGKEEIHEKSRLLIASEPVAE
jgi:ammonium transporter, Amt family